MTKLSAAGHVRILWCAGRTITFLGLAATLTGCLTDRPPIAEKVENYPTDVRQRHPIAVREGEHSVAIFIGVNRGGLMPQQRTQVLAFAHTWAREATGGIVIDQPTDTPNARAAADTLPEVRSILSVAGVPPQAVAVRPYRPDNPIKLATIRLRYPKMIAEAGPCGEWPKDIGPSYGSDDGENWPYWNFGCANQRNMAAMVENPADLVQPRAETPAYAGRRSVMLDKYRKGEGTTTNYGDTNKGKISDIGK